MKIITQGELITGGTPEEVIMKLQQGGLIEPQETKEYMKEVRKRVAIYLGPDTQINDEDPVQFLEHLHEVGLIKILERGASK